MKTERMSPRLNLKCIFMSALVAVPLTATYAAPATPLKVCIKKSTGAIVAKSACVASELVFSEQSYAAERDRILYVAKSGAKYKSVHAALADTQLLRPSATAPVVVRVGPGTFLLSDATTIPQYVTLEGAGVRATTLKTPKDKRIILDSNSTLKRINIQSDISVGGLGVVRTDAGSSQILIEDVSVALSGSTSGTTGFSLGANNTTLRRVIVTNPTNGAGGEGIGISGTAVTVSDADITLYGQATGLSVNDSPDVTLDNVRTTITALQGDNSLMGLLVGGASSKMYANGLVVKINASAGVIGHALYVSGPVSDVVVKNSVFESTGTTVGTVTARDGGIAQVLDSRVTASGTNAPVGVAGASTIKVAATHLIGGTVWADGSSTVTCAGVYDENFTYSASSCP